MVEQQQQLYGILQGLSSVNKDEREASESCFEKQWMSRPSQVFPALLELVRQCDNQTVPTPYVLRSISKYILGPYYWSCDAEEGRHSECQSW